MNYLNFISLFNIFKNKSPIDLKNLLHIYYDIFQEKIINVENEKFFTVFNDLTKALTSIKDTEELLEKLTRSLFKRIAEYQVKFLKM